MADIRLIPLDHVISYQIQQNNALSHTIVFCRQGMVGQQQGQQGTSQSFRIRETKQDFQKFCVTVLPSPNPQVAGRDKTPALLPGAIRFLFGLLKMSTTMSDRASVFTNDACQIYAWSTFGQLSGKLFCHGACPTGQVK